MTRILIPVLAALALAASAPVFAQSPVPAPTRKPDPAAGEIIAKRWCASCHLVAPDQTRASADAPWSDTLLYP